MLPSAEESKAERLKRQQARFRDRGGAFVPSNSNPLVNILLARTVSGESPSKSRPKDVAPKRLSSSKARQSSPSLTAGIHTLSEENQPVAGCSKSKRPAPRKRTPKTVELEGGEATKPTTKRRGRPAKSSKKAPGTDFDMEEPPLAPKGKRKQRNNPSAPPTSDSSAKPKPKPKPKPNTTKKVVEVFLSDDDQTLVEAPRAKSSFKRRMRHEDDGETDEDALPVTKRAILPADDSKAPGTKTTARVAREKFPGMASSMKKTLKDVGERTRDEGHVKTNAKKRLALSEDEEVEPPPAKKGKSKKSKNAIEPEPMPVPCTNKDVETEEIHEAGGKRKGKGVSDRVVAVNGDDEQPTSKPKKRKKEDDNYNDRPRKAVKFVETGPPYSSTLKLKENRSGRKHESVASTSNSPRLKLAAKPPLRTKTSTSKGPPREVLERIKASAARYLRCADSEPDELDCLS